jgi:hypothetical protein
MKKYDSTWNDVNTLVTYLVSRNSRVAFDEYFLRKFGNSAPGELLQNAIARVQKRLDEAETEQ